MPTDTPDPQDLIRDVMRKIYRTFPGIKEDLANRERQQVLLDLLSPLATAHSLGECMDRILKAGYHVTPNPPADPPRERKNDRESSSIGAKNVSFRAGTQKAVLLDAYVRAGENGLNAVEAFRAARLDEKACYWKRVSELVGIRFIDRVTNAHGGTLMRLGECDSPREVYVVTELGLAYFKRKNPF